MNKPLQLLAAASTAFSLANCASSPAVSHAPPPSPHGGNGMILVYRTPGIVGAPTKPFIWVNRAQMPGKLSRGGFYACEVKPGTSKVEFSWHDHRAGLGESVGIVATSGLAGLAIEQLAGHEVHGIDVPVRPGQTRYVLMDGYKLSEVPQAEGAAAVAECGRLN